MITLYVMCGIPGSGKTTLAKKMESERNVRRHSYDECDDGWDMYWEKIIDDLKRGDDVVCDDTNISIEDRMSIINKLSGIECKKVLVIMDTPVSECVRRNSCRQESERIPEFQIYLAARMMKIPVGYEEWDEIYKCSL